MRGPTCRWAEKLAAELGDLPLAAAQAAAYLEQTDLPPGDYLRRHADDFRWSAPSIPSPYGRRAHEEHGTHPYSTSPSRG